MFWGIDCRTLYFRDTSAVYSSVDSLSIQLSSTFSVRYQIEPLSFWPSFRGFKLDQNVRTNLQSSIPLSFGCNRGILDCNWLVLTFRESILYLEMRKSILYLQTSYIVSKFTRCLTNEIQNHQYSNKFVHFCNFHLVSSYRIPRKTTKMSN